MIRKIFISLGKVVAACSFAFALINANSVCMFIYHQPEVPNKVKKLRRF